MTRRATAADIPRIVDMGARFVAAAWGVLHSEEDTAAYVRWIIEEAGVVFLNDHAMLGAIADGLPFNQAIVAATEVFWWSERRGSGLPLLRAFERWASDEIGARFTVLTTVHEMNPAAGRLYERRGYRLRECCYVKDMGA